MIQNARETRGCLENVLREVSMQILKEGEDRKTHGKPPFFTEWVWLDGAGAYLTLLFIGGVVRIKAGFDDGATMSATCEAEGLVPVAELSRMLAVPATVLEIGTRREVRGWRIPAMNYCFWSMVGAEPTSPGVIVLSLEEGLALRKIIEHHMRGWIPMPTKAVRPFGQEMQVTQFMVLPSSHSNSDTSLLYASGVDRERNTWRICRFLDGTFSGKVFTRAAVACYGGAPDAAAAQLNRVIKRATRLGEAVEVDKMSTIATLEVSRPGPLDLELRLTGQTRARESYDLRVLTLELHQMLTAARAKAWVEGIILESAAIGNLILGPGTAKSLYRLLTNAF